MNIIYIFVNLFEYFVCVLQCVYCVHHASSQTDRYLFKVAVLAGSLLGVLVVNDVQRSFPLFQLQTFNLRLQLIQLLLQVFALLHVLDPKHDQIAGWEAVM